MSQSKMCLMIMEKNERLQFARKKAGFETASEAARALGISTQTYAAHENGSRSFKEGSARKYARRFGVDVTWLIFGKGSPEEREMIDEKFFPATDLPEHINLQLFERARKEARLLEKEITGGGVSSFETYKELLLMTYRDLLERAEIEKHN